MIVAFLITSSARVTPTPRWACSTREPRSRLISLLSDGPLDDLRAKFALALSDRKEAWDLMTQRAEEIAELPGKTAVEAQIEARRLKDGLQADAQWFAAEATRLATLPVSEAQSLAAMAVTEARRLATLPAIKAGEAQAEARRLAIEGQAKAMKLTVEAQRLAELPGQKTAEAAQLAAEARREAALLASLPYKRAAEAQKEAQRLAAEAQAEAQRLVVQAEAIASLPAQKLAEAQVPSVSVLSIPPPIPCPLSHMHSPPPRLPACGASGSPARSSCRS